MKLKVKNIDLLSPIYYKLYKVDSNELINDFVNLVNYHLNIVSGLSEVNYDKLTDNEFENYISTIYDIYLDKNEFYEFTGKRVEVEKIWISSEYKVYSYITKVIKTDFDKKKFLKGIRKYAKRLKKTLELLYKDSIDYELDYILDKSLVILENQGFNDELKNMVMMIKEDSKQCK